MRAATSATQHTAGAPFTGKIKTKRLHAASAIRCWKGIIKRTTSATLYKVILETLKAVSMGQAQIITRRGARGWIYWAVGRWIASGASRRRISRNVDRSLVVKVMCL